MNYLSQFEQLVTELKMNPEIQLIDHYIGDPATENNIKTIEQSIGFEIPSDVASFYSEMDGFLLEWAVTSHGQPSTDQTKTGSIEILPIAEVFKDWKDVTWSDYEKGDEFKAVKPLDFFQPEACSAFLFTNKNGCSPTIYYHYFGEYLYDTGYSFSDYVNRLLASRGFFYWIETLCRECQESPQSQQFFDVMPKLFKDFNRGLFIPGNASKNTKSL